MDRKIYLSDLIAFKDGMKYNLEKWESFKEVSDTYCMGYREAIDDLEIFIYNRQQWG